MRRATMMLLGIWMAFVQSSIFTWAEGSPWKWAAAVGHLWRTTGDICGPGLADWENAMKIAFDNETLFEWAGPGFWNDPEMMIVGMPRLSVESCRVFVAS
jgi:hypothetical protein